MPNTSKKQYRAAVVGLGGMGRKYVRAYEAMGQVAEIVACERREDRVEGFRKEHPDVPVYSDADEMLRNGKPDIVSVATNTPSNEALVLAAVEAGVPRIMCEKPMAHSLAAAQRMIDACERNGVRLAVDHSRRWAKPCIELRDLLANGTIGEVSLVVYTSGGAVFACIGTHILDFARMLTGRDFVSLVGRVDVPRRPNPRGPQFHDPGAHCLAYFDDGSRFLLDLSEDLSTPARLLIEGTMGRVTVEQSTGIWRVEARQGKDREEPVWVYSTPLSEVPFPQEPPDFFDALVGALEELLGDGPISSTGHDGYAALEAIVATHVSSDRGGSLIEMPIVGDDRDREFTFT